MASSLAKLIVNPCFAITSPSTHRIVAAGAIAIAAVCLAGVGNLAQAGISKTLNLCPVVPEHSGERGARDSPGGILTCFSGFRGAQESFPASRRRPRMQFMKVLRPGVGRLQIRY